MVEQQRLMEEERQRMRKEHEKRVKEEQKKILGKNNSRPKLSFTLKPITWVYLISCSFTCDIYTLCRFFGIVLYSTRTVSQAARTYQDKLCSNNIQSSPECICDERRNLAALNCFIWFWWPRAHRNGIINSMPARFRSPIQMGLTIS